MDVPQALLYKAGHNSLHLNATAASFHHSHLLRHRIGVLLHSYFKKIAPLNQVFRLKDKWCQRSIQLKGFNSLQLSNDAFTSTCSIAFSLFNGGGHEGHFEKAGMFNSNSKISRKNSFNGRKWTNVLLAANILFYIAQLATQGKLLLWGAKINSLIDKGQLWRLVTSSFLHANIGHLMVNCYSLNSVGPTVESFSGPRRYLAVYFVSAIASSAMSYQFSRMPAVGASGAIFGLIGSVAVFVLRHKDIVGGGKEDLLHIARVIALNMVLGLLSNGIDNWGHLGGLIGGVAASWLIGPAWKYDSTTRDGRRVFSDSAPLYNLFRITRVHKQWK